MFAYPSLQFPGQQPIYEVYVCGDSPDQPPPYGEHIFSNVLLLALDPCKALYLLVVLGPGVVTLFGFFARIGTAFGIPSRVPVWVQPPSAPEGIAHRPFILEHDQGPLTQAHVPS